MEAMKNPTFEKDFQNRLTEAICTADGIESMLALLSNVDVQEEFSQLHLATAINGTYLLTQKLTELLSNLFRDYDCHYIPPQNEWRN